MHASRAKRPSVVPLAVVPLAADRGPQPLLPIPLASDFLHTHPASPLSVPETRSHYTKEK